MLKWLGVLVLGIFTAPLFAQDNGIVAFHIPAGTGANAWNTPDKPAILKVGQTLRIYNDDSVVHFLHTEGAPCPHGTNPFGPGEYYDCVASAPYNEADQNLYDHNYGPDAQFYVQCNP